MEALFLKLLNMSITAGWLALVVMVLRLLLHKVKAPKFITILLWGFVMVRLVCPFSLESALSLIPSAQTVPEDIMYSESPMIESGIPIVNETINPILSETVKPNTEAVVNPIWDITSAASVVWLAGMLLMFGYMAASYMRVQKNVCEAIPLKENIWICDDIDTPFIFRVFHPRIYLPSNMDTQDMKYVLAHERAHLQHLDHIWKPFGFLVLSVYWFHPVLWAAYILFCKDLELACDENVLRKFGTEVKKSYADALINCSVPRRNIAACPLAFGETGVKSRIRSVLCYKKPAVGLTIVAIGICLVVAVCFLTDPIGTNFSTIDRIVKQKGYDIIEQEIREVTLSVSASKLPDTIYSSEGHEFKENEIIAYRDDSVTIYLRSVQYANEGNEQLYFCFDFKHTPPKAGGKTIYPYEICENGYRNAFYLKSKTIQANDTEYENAIQVRGQGDSTKIWLYVSTEILKKIEGEFSFDIYMNEITYLKKGVDADILSELEESEVSTDNESAVMKLLKEKYPEYFGLKYQEGLKIYVWQMAKDSYTCALASGTDLEYSLQDILRLKGIPMEEMRKIVAFYNIPREKVKFVPIQHPLSSYLHETDEAFAEKAAEVFWGEE